MEPTGRVVFANGSHWNSTPCGWAKRAVVIVHSCDANVTALESSTRAIPWSFRYAVYQFPNRRFPLPKFFYTLPEFQAIGGPGRTRAYELAGLGLLDIVKDPAGRVGVTADEVRRYFAAARPIGEAKRDLSRATAASLASRAKRAA